MMLEYVVRKDQNGYHRFLSWIFTLHAKDFPVVSKGLIRIPASQWRFRSVGHTEELFPFAEKTEGYVTY